MHFGIHVDCGSDLSHSIRVIQPIKWMLVQQNRPSQLGELAPNCDFEFAHRAWITVDAHCLILLCRLWAMAAGMRARDDLSKERFKDGSAQGGQAFPPRGGNAPGRGAGVRFALGRAVALPEGEEAVREHHQGHVAVEAVPEAALVVVQARLALGVLVDALDDPAPMHPLDQVFERVGIMPPAK